MLIYVVYHYLRVLNLTCKKKQRQKTLRKAAKKPSFSSVSSLRSKDCSLLYKDSALSVK